ncbi:MAG: hypothetical protein IPL97_04765 [Niastella sp.]|nr:hypothetical protein [Niastella sp.]
MQNQSSIIFTNIYVALLAKMGENTVAVGTVDANELIIGVGAFQPRDAAHRYVGSAFCFSNDGKFEGFAAIKSETKLLAGSIKDQVEKFIEQHQSVRQIIIHFYKEISDPEELRPYLKCLTVLVTVMYLLS